MVRCRSRCVVSSYNDRSAPPFTRAALRETRTPRFRVLRSRLHVLRNFELSTRLHYLRAEPRGAQSEVRRISSKSFAEHEERGSQNAGRSIKGSVLARLLRP